MKNLPQLCILLMLVTLTACNDQAENPTSSEQPFDFANDQTSQQIEQLESMIAENPGDQDSLAFLADLYFEAGRYNEALQAYDMLLVINPDCADCYNDRGLSLFYIGDPALALESFDKAIAIDPNFTHAWLSKGFVLVSSGRYKEAVTPLKKVKELDTSGALALQADKYLAMVAEHSPP